jgi:hypothetical protein
MLLRAEEGPGKFRYFTVNFAVAVLVIKPETPVKVMV